MLERKKRRRQPRAAVVDRSLPLVPLPLLKLADERRYRREFDHSLGYPELGYLGCSDAALVEFRPTAPELLGDGTDFGPIASGAGVTSLTRLEPGGCTAPATGARPVAGDGIAWIVGPVGERVSDAHHSTTNQLNDG